MNKALLMILLFSTPASAFEYKVAEIWDCSDFFTLRWPLITENNLDVDHIMISVDEQDSTIGRRSLVRIKDHPIEIGVYTRMEGDSRVWAWGLDEYTGFFKDQFWIDTSGTGAYFNFRDKTPDEEIYPSFTSQCKIR